MIFKMEKITTLRIIFYILKNVWHPCTHLTNCNSNYQSRRQPKADPRHFHMSPRGRHCKQLLSPWPHFIFESECEMCAWWRLCPMKEVGRRREREVKFWMLQQEGQQWQLPRWKCGYRASSNPAFSTLTGESCEKLMQGYIKQWHERTHNGI